MKKSIIAVLAATLATAVAAQTRYPEKPIRMIVPFPPGSASDFLARTTGQKLNEKYGQQVVIDNRPGAGGVVGSTLLAKADNFLFTIVARFDDVRFLRMAGCAARFVAGQTILVNTLGHFFLAARMLSTRLGYGRPAALALHETHSKRLILRAFKGIVTKAA